MSTESRNQLERQQYELLAQIAGEEPIVEKLSSIEMLRENVRLLGIIQQNGTGNGGTPGAPSAEDFGPTADRPTGVATGYQYFDTDLMELIVWDSDSWEPVDTTADAQARSDLEALTTRQVATHTTASLAAGASETFTLVLPRTFTLLSITVSAQAFTRGYHSTAARTADASRLPGVTPSDAVFYGLAFDANLPDKGALSVPVNEDFSLNPQGELYMSVRNTGSSAAAITLTLEYLEREAV